MKIRNPELAIIITSVTAIPYGIIVTASGIDLGALNIIFGAFSFLGIQAILDKVRKEWT